MRWLVTVTLISIISIFEYYCFYHFASQHYLYNYPSGIDQANYLYASYSLYENIIHKGLRHGLALYQPIAASALFIIQASFVFLIFGASRLTALSIGFFYFLVAQAIALTTLTSVSPHFGTRQRDPTLLYTLPLLFLGLLLSTTTFFNQFGSPFDFRMDFTSACLYGITICLILQSQLFLIRRWVIVAAIAASWLILMRCLTSVYITGLILCLFIYFISRKEWRRLLNLFCFSTIVTVIVSPILWIHRHLLYTYYIVGHATGTEKIMRAKMAGVHDIWSNLLYYPNVFASLHLGWLSLVEMGIVLIVVGVSLTLDRYRALINKSILLFLVLSIVIPLGILTMDQSKSSVPINIIFIPFLLLITLITGQRYKSTIALTAFFLVIGVGNFYLKSMQPFTGFTYHQSVADINKFVLDIGDYAEAHELHTLNATADIYTDFLAAVPSYYYEQTHKLLSFECRFGCGTQTWVESKSVALNAVANSNLFISAEKFVPHREFNFDKSILEYQGELRPKALQRLVLVGGYVIDGDRFQIFMGG